MVYRYNVFTGELDVSSASSSGSSSIQFDSDSGSATTVLGVLNLIGTAAQGISSSAAGNTVTLTVADSTATQKGVVELSTDSEAIAGTLTDYHVINPSSLKAKLGAQTSKSMIFGTGTTAALSWTAPLINGQIVIGSTAGFPTAANLTSSDASVTITNGSNSINLQSAATATVHVTDSGSATPAAGSINILGTAAQGISTSGAGSTVTLTVADSTETHKGVIELATAAETTTGTSTSLAVHPSGLNTKLGAQTSHGIILGTGGAGNNLGATAELADGELLIGSTGNIPSVTTLTAGLGMTIVNAPGSITLSALSTAMIWVEATIDTALLANVGYIANKGTLLIFTMPATAAIGSRIKIMGKGVGLFTVAQNAGQVIHFGAFDTTTGVGGSLTSTLRYDVVELVCITANTDWSVAYSIGNIDVI